MVFLLIGIFTSQVAIWQLSAVCLTVFLSIGIGAIPSLSNYQYTSWIITAVVAGMIYPAFFLEWGEFDLRDPWVILIIVQLVMFGMGVQMSLKDIRGIATSGRGVLIGFLSHFSIMPVVGFLLIQVFDFEPEIAAGIILIGSCAGGLASNVMAYLARANLVLSITVTAMSTLAAPLMTPFLMQVFSGTLIDISFFNMMLDIVKIVIIPIGAAMLYDYLKTEASANAKQIVWTLCFISAAWLVALPLGLWGYLESNLQSPLIDTVVMGGFIAAAVIAGAGYYWLTVRVPKTDDFMPYVSMFGIIYFTLITTAAGQENLLRIGMFLFLAAIIHNLAGYLLGYWLSRLFRLEKRDARAIAFEVGMQNGGMASGIAGAMGKLGTVGLAAVVFSAWMNITGSILAYYWRRRPLNDDQITEQEEN